MTPRSLAGLLARLESLLRPRRYRLDADRYVDEVTGTQLRYHEGGRWITAGYETLDGKEIGVFPQQIGSWEPRADGDRTLDDDERERVIAAIRGAYARRGIEVADTAELVPSEVGVSLVEARNRRNSEPSTSRDIDRR